MQWQSVITENSQRSAITVTKHHHNVTRVTLVFPIKNETKQNLSFRNLMYKSRFYGCRFGGL